MREEKEAAKAKWKNTEHEMDQLKKELEELRAGFTAEKNELEKDYQKQVDEMFFFDYQCCIRKNDITQNIPSYPSNDEDATVSGLAQENKNSDAISPSDGQWLYFYIFFLFHLALSGCNDTFKLLIHTHFILLMPSY